jgi:hypothetical protein
MPIRAATQPARRQSATPLFKILRVCLRSRGGHATGQIAWVAAASIFLATIYGLASPREVLAAGSFSSESLGPVQIVNGRSNPIFVAFTTSDHHLGLIGWGPGCTQVLGGAVIAAGKTCSATVTSNGASSRFCAANALPTATAKNAVTMDCFNAQANHQTMVETTFDPNGTSCFNQGNCVWYDISVIPSTSTDALWNQNECANTDGASYNLPVSIALRWHDVLHV